MRRENAQNGVADKEHEQTEGHYSQTSKIDHTSAGEDVAIFGVLVVGVGVVQVVVLFDVFGEEQQAGRG